jgi:hypothetical protein
MQNITFCFFLSLDILSFLDVPSFTFRLILRVIFFFSFYLYLLIVLVFFRGPVPFLFLTNFLWVFSKTKKKKLQQIFISNILISDKREIMAINGNTRSLRQHVQRSLGDDFVEPPASVMSAMPNDDVGDESEGEEFQPKAATRGRTTITPGSRGRGRPSRTGPKTSGTVNQGDEDSMETSSVTMTTGNNTTFGGGQQSEEKGYFHHLLAGKTNIQVLVDQWIDSYQANRDEALIELMQFFLDSSGCKGKLTQTMYLKMEHVDMLRAMTEHFDEVK